MWQVQVGLPKVDAFAKRFSNAKPNMDNVGQPVTPGEGEPYLYNTRREARDAAKRRSGGNPFWNYRVREV